MLTLLTIFEIITILYPIIITVFFLMLSLYHKNLKGLAIVAGGILLIVLSYILDFMMGDTNSNNKIINKINTMRSSLTDNDNSFTCKLLNYNIFNKGISFNVIYVMYILYFLSRTMIYNNYIDDNVMLLLMTISLINIIYVWLNRCVDYKGMGLSILIGIMYGFVWYMFLKLIFLFNDDTVFYTNGLTKNSYRCNYIGNDFKCQNTENTDNNEVDVKDNNVKDFIPYDSNNILIISGIAFALLFMGDTLM